VIVNIANGDGDMSIMDTVADQLRARVTANGENVKVLGYVYTSQTNRPLTSVYTSINGWLNVRNGKTHYDGIFFDETTRDCGTSTQPMLYRDYYRTLREYVWNKIPTIQDVVVNNPGTAINTCYLETNHDTADVFVTFEGSATTYSQIAGPSNGYVGYTGGNVFDAAGYNDGGNWDSSRFWHLVYNVSSLQMKTIIDTAFSRYAGYVDTTDDVLPNPWDAKPTYLKQAISYANSK
jgi:Spherulation-specific family 4